MKHFFTKFKNWLDSGFWGLYVEQQENPSIVAEGENEYIIHVNNIPVKVYIVGGVHKVDLSEYSLNFIGKYVGEISKQIDSTQKELLVDGKHFMKNM